MCGYDVVGVAQQTSALLVRVQVPLSAISMFIHVYFGRDVWSCCTLTLNNDFEWEYDILFWQIG